MFHMFIDKFVFVRCVDTLHKLGSTNASLTANRKLYNSSI